MMTCCICTKPIAQNKSFVYVLAIADANTPPFFGRAHVNCGVQVAATQEIFLELKAEATQKIEII